MKPVYSYLMISAAVILLTVSMVWIAGCTESANTGQPIQKETCPVQDFGNGVFYFPCTAGDFATTLSRHISSDNITVQAIAPVPSVGSYNSLTGYIVVVKRG